MGIKKLNQIIATTAGIAGIVTFIFFIFDRYFASNNNDLSQARTTNTPEIQPTEVAPTIDESLKPESGSTSDTMPPTPTTLLSGVRLNLNYISNGQSAKTNAYFASQIRFKLSQNALHETHSSNPALSLNATLSVTTAHSQQYNAYTADCSLIYTIENHDSQNIIGGRPRSIGGISGFSANVVESDCAKKIVLSTANEIAMNLKSESSR